MRSCVVYGEAWQVCVLVHQDLVILHTITVNPQSQAWDSAYVKNLFFSILSLF